VLDLGSGLEFGSLVLIDSPVQARVRVLHPHPQI